MAAIVNDRDVLLQATNPRTVTVNLPPYVLVPGVSGITLVAPTNFIHITASGVANPGDIQINAILKQVYGTVTWEVVEGQANIYPPAGGSNLIRITDAGNMGTDVVRIRASVTFENVLYQDEITLSKIRDGFNGPAGTRGTVNVSIAVGAPVWSNVMAAHALFTATSSHQILIADLVTQTFGGWWAETRGWNGSAWILVQHVFSGNMLVNGAIMANHMSANSITASNGALGDLTVTTAKIANEIASNTWYSSGGSAGWMINKSGNAVFQDVTIRGYVQSGTRIRDSRSGYHIYAMAVAGGSGSVGSTVSNGQIAVHSPANSQMGGPGFHSQIETRRRIRSGEGDNPVVFDISINAVVDHYFTLWYNVQGDYGDNSWHALQGMTEPSSGEGSVTVNAILVHNIGWSSWVQFGVSGTNSSGQTFSGGGQSQVSQYTMNIRAGNV